MCVSPTIGCSFLEKKRYLLILFSTVLGMLFSQTLVKERKHFGTVAILSYVGLFDLSYKLVSNAI